MKYIYVNNCEYCVYKNEPKPPMLLNREGVDLSYHIDSNLTFWIFDEFYNSFFERNIKEYYSFLDSQDKPRVRELFKLDVNFLEVYNKLKEAANELVDSSYNMLYEQILDIMDTVFYNLSEEQIKELDNEK